MRKILFAALVVGTTLGTVAPAMARQGCGPDGHRDRAGYCRPNRGGPVVVAPGLRVGLFYPGHGYWDGGRYWGHRYRWHGAWRYR